MCVELAYVLLFLTLVYAVQTQLIVTWVQFHCTSAIFGHAVNHTSWPTQYMHMLWVHGCQTSRSAVQEVAPVVSS